MKSKRRWGACHCSYWQPCYSLRSGCCCAPGCWGQDWQTRGHHQTCCAYWLCPGNYHQPQGKVCLPWGHACPRCAAWSIRQPLGVEGAWHCYDDSCKDEPCDFDSYFEGGCLVTVPQEEVNQQIQRKDSCQMTAAGWRPSAPLVPLPSRPWGQANWVLMKSCHSQETCSVVELRLSWLQEIRCLEQVLGCGWERPWDLRVQGYIHMAAGHADPCSCFAGGTGKGNWMLACLVPCACCGWEAGHTSQTWEGHLTAQRKSRRDCQGVHQRAWPLEAHG